MVRLENEKLREELDKIRAQVGDQGGEEDRRGLACHARPGALL
jgi:hypothetical protein